MAITREQIQLIIDGMHEGKNVRSQLKEMGIVPREFYEAVAEDNTILNAYHRAQASRAEGLVDEIIEIADTEEDSQRARNRIDARRWYASKMQPQKYGDRIDLNVNHTVDISGALREANNRVSAASAKSQQNEKTLARRDVVEIAATQAVEITRLVNSSKDQDENDPEDIFS